MALIDDLEKLEEQIDAEKPLSFYKKDFENLLVTLATHNELNFYSHMLFNMRLNLDYSLSTAGIYYKNDNFYIDVNPRFLFEELKTNTERMIVLVHEVLHALYLHFVRAEKRDKQLWNIAGDLCINQFLFKRLPADSTLKTIGVDLGVTYPFKPNLTAEQYYKLLEQDKQQNPEKYQSGSGVLHIQDLLDSDDISDIEKEIITDKLKDIVKKAKDKSRGNIPDEILSIIDLLFTPPKVDWRNELKHVVGNKKIIKEYTIKRRNRRFMDRMDICGKIKRTGFDLACIVDVSGSMSDGEIVQGLSEIKSICDWSMSSMTLVQVDTQASEPEEYTGWQRQFNRKRSGGTYLEPAIDVLDRTGVEYGAYIIITDGATDKEPRWSKLDIPVFVLCSEKKCGFLMGENMKLFDLSEGLKK